MSKDIPALLEEAADGVCVKNFGIGEVFTLRERKRP